VFYVFSIPRYATYQRIYVWAIFIHISTKYPTHKR
jgi:hypothetical protein